MRHVWLLMGLIVCLPACDRIGAERDPFNPDPDAPSFRLGQPHRFAEHGLYFDFIRDYQTLLVSRPASGSTMLVALDARCTQDGRPVDYSELTRMIHCPVCGSRWTTDGLIQSGSPATASLDRYRIRLAGDGPAGQRDLIVDQSRRFRQSFTREIGKRTVEIQEWSATDSFYHFDLDPRHNDGGLADKIAVGD